MQIKAINAADLLTIWETGLRQSLIQKSLHLLSAAYAEPDIKSLALLSIGERDRRLMQVRKKLFGSRLISLSTCPHCNSKVEWEMSLEKLDSQQPEQMSNAKEFSLQVNGFDIQYRLPNSLDILKAITQSEIYNGRKLISNCILNVQQNQQAFNPADLPTEVYEEMDRQLEKRDPQANIQLRLSCPDCSHQWNAMFDILHYLWKEIDDWAGRLLKDIVLLARAFGWAEKDILLMTSQRRQLYLQMLRS